MTWFRLSLGLAKDLTCMFGRYFWGIKVVSGVSLNGASVR